MIIFGKKDRKYKLHKKRKNNFHFSQSIFHFGCYHKVLKVQECWFLHTLILSVGRLLMSDSHLHGTEIFCQRNDRHPSHLVYHVQIACLVLGKNLVEVLEPILQHFWTWVLVQWIMTLNQNLTTLVNYSSVMIYFRRQTLLTYLQTNWVQQSQRDEEQSWRWRMLLMGLCQTSKINKTNIKYFSFYFQLAHLYCGLYCID